MSKLILLLTGISAVWGAGLPIIELPKDPIALENILDNIIHNSTYDRGTDCKRECVVGKNRICYMFFHAENHHAMGPACGNCSRGVTSDCNLPQCVPADGFERGVLTLNRQIPGPLLEVCEGDLVAIDLLNSMHSESTSIHWHGILQRNSQYMDGVPLVTQCGIHPMNIFRYTFSIEEYGTYFYHSHSGVQRSSGIYGGLIVRRPLKIDVNTKYYDVDDHVILITDWSHESPEMFTIGLPTREPGLLPQSMLINGRGSFFNDVTRTWTPSPYERLYVRSGLRYRFRIINAGSTVCPILIQIEGHQMVIVASDGGDVEPKTVDSLFMLTGERYDVIVNATQRSGMFWLYVKAVGMCEGLPNTVFQRAIISYDSEKSVDRIPTTTRNGTEYTRGIAINNPDARCGTSKTDLCLTDLKGINVPRIMTREATVQEYFAFSIRQITNVTQFFAQREYSPYFVIRDNNLFLGTINTISHTPTPYPTLTQWNQNNDDMYCNIRTKPKFCNKMEICVCPHYLSVGSNVTVEFILIDESPDTLPVSHPMHLHGYKFAVVAQGRIPGNTSLTSEIVQRIRAAGNITFNTKNPPIKDTVSVQNQGFTIIRFYTDNPGAWLLHCHIEDHMVFGMGFILLVNGQLPDVPKDFPRCGNFPSTKKH